MEKSDQIIVIRSGWSSFGAWLVVVLLVGAGAASYFYAYRPLSSRAATLAAQLEERDRQLKEAREKETRITAELRLQAVELGDLRGELDRSRAEIAESERVLVELKENLKQNGVEVTGSRGRITVTLIDRVLFRSGRAEIMTRGEAVLMKLGQALKGLTGKTIQVSGHTDEVPIRPGPDSPYPTNWELSAARATNVVRFLEERAGVAPGMLMAAGHGPNRPVASNATPTGRAKNRRIEILLLPQSIKPVKGSVDTQLTQSSRTPNGAPWGVFGPVR